MIGVLTVDCFVLYMNVILCQMCQEIKLLCAVKEQIDGRHCRYIRGPTNGWCKHSAVRGQPQWVLWTQWIGVNNRNVSFGIWWSAEPEKSSTQSARRRLLNQIGRALLIAVCWWIYCPGNRSTCGTSWKFNADHLNSIELNRNALS